MPTRQEKIDRLAKLERLIELEGQIKKEKKKAKKDVPWSETLSAAGGAMGDSVGNVLERIAFAKFHGSPSIMPQRTQKQERAESLRPRQTFGQNVAAGAIGLSPYLVPVAGQALFAGELATKPEDIPAMLTQFAEHGRTTQKAMYKDGLWEAMGKTILPLPYMDGDPEAIETIRQQPIEHLTSAAIALGAVKGGGMLVRKGKVIHSGLKGAEAVVKGEGGPIVGQFEPTKLPGINVPDPSIPMPGINVPKVPPPVPPKPSVKPPVVPKTEPVVPVKTAPKVAKTAPLPEKIVGLNKAEIGYVRQATGRAELPVAERQRIIDVVAEAKRTGTDRNASDIANDVLKTNRQLTAVEQAGMVLEAGRLDNLYEASVKTANGLIKKGDTKAAALERGRGESILEQRDRLETASNQAGRETARALSIRRMLINREDFSLAGTMLKAQTAKGSKLSLKQTAKIEKVVSEHGVLEKQVKDLEAKYEKLLTINEKIEAGQVSRKIRVSPKTKAAKKLLIDERASIKKEIAKLGYRTNVGIDPKAAYLVGKLATNYIKAGNVNLKEVVKLVRQDIPDLTVRDVYQSLISKDPARQGRAKSKANKQVAILKRQAKLLLDIEKAEKGIFEPSKKIASAPLEIRTLQKQLRDLRTTAYQTGMTSGKLEKALRTINELQDQLANHYRTIKKKKQPESIHFEALRQKAHDLRRTMKVEDQLADLNKQLETGDFVIKEKPVQRKLPPALERKEVELKIARKKVRAAVEDMVPLTLKRGFVETVNTLRTLKATADMSYLFRQGAFLAARRPIKAAKAFGQSAQAFFSEFKAEQIDKGIRSAPHHYLREKAGLHITETGGRISNREEVFMSRVAEKIPLYGKIVKASDRNMVTGLNLLRTAAFDGFLEKFPNATHAELKAWADYVNVASGRGNLGQFKQAGNTLSLGFFAPRFAVSRIQTPFKVLQHWKEPRVRKEIAKDMVATVGAGVTVLALAKLAGYEVGDDFRSPDFLKIIVGNTKIDIFAGFQQPARVIMRTSGVLTDNLGLTDFGTENLSPLELWGRFSSYKLNPIITMPLELMRGKSMVGEERTPTETAIESIMPMFLSDVRDAWRLEGPGQAAMVGGLTFFGVGANTYEKSGGAKTTQEYKRLGEALKTMSGVR